MPRVLVWPLPGEKRKPRYGEPCNRCGACCFAVVCPLGAHVLGLKYETSGPCPALVKVDGEHACGLIADPARFAPELVQAHGAAMMSESAALIINASGGCDTLAAGEQPDAEWDRAFEQRMRDERAARRRAKLAWRVPWRSTKNTRAI